MVDPDADDTAERIRAALAGVQEAVNDQVSTAVQHKVDEALTMPAVGAVGRAIDPIERSVREAIEAELRQADRRS